MCSSYTMLCKQLKQTPPAATALAGDDNCASTVLCAYMCCCWCADEEYHPAAKGGMPPMPAGKPAMAHEWTARPQPQPHHPHPCTPGWRTKCHTVSWGCTCTGRCFSTLIPPPPPPTNPHTPHKNHPYHNNCCMLLLLKASRADQQAHDSFQGHPLKPISTLASCHAHP